MDRFSLTQKKIWTGLNNLFYLCFLNHIDAQYGALQKFYFGASFTQNKKKNKLFRNVSDQIQKKKDEDPSEPIALKKLQLGIEL
jgi:hypothetical protein